MNNYKIKVNNEAESKEAQELFEQLGFKWAGDNPENGDWYSHLYAENSTCCYLSPYVWGGLGDRFKELTLPQLRDLVVLHRNDVKDATHEHKDMPEIHKYLHTSACIYAWMLGSSSWEESDRSAQWHKENTRTIQEQVLISGADALRALADGKEVELRDKENNWVRANNHHLLGLFLGNAFDFRLKPRTIKLSLEIPSPFEPKLGETYYFITTSNSQGFDFTEFEDSDGDELYMQLGAYRSASDASKAFEALRGGIKG
ncbi:hypothetical protein [Acinetobacter modestus]|uniref:hypothetical protein n=1 Tax=Acinetobacter modestus TaxID=1776740 RepID=UPI00320ACA10